jgi:hypothetical protein
VPFASPSGVMAPIPVSATVSSASITAAPTISASLDVAV